MAHPWLNAENIPTFLTPAAGNPDRREVWVGAASNNLDLGEETVKDVHSPRSGENGNKNNAVLSYPMI